MKTTHILLTLGLAGCASLAAAQTDSHLRHAEMPHFDIVDTNNDGFLGIEEARAAFNNLTIVDGNTNGFVEKGEAEEALPGLRYTNDTHEDNEDRVGPAEYSMMAEQFVKGYVEQETEL